MKRKAWINGLYGALLAPAALLLASQATAAPEKIHDFGLIDHQDAQHQISRLGYYDAVVIISQANSCQTNIEQLHMYKYLRTMWEPQGVKFLMLNSSNEDSLESIRSLASTYNIDFPIMYDRTQLVSESLGITHAGEVLVIDPETLKLAYKGPLDVPSRRRAGSELDSQLADALTRVVNGEIDKMDTVTAAVENDCKLDFPVKQMHANNVPDYAEDVAPILKENCAHCHVEGGIGPFPMNSYEMVRGWSPMIRETVMTKRMPPAQVDPEYNHFTNANYLAIEDQQTLVHWIDAGAPRGDSKQDPLHAVQPLDGGWQLDSPPDMVVDVPAFTVPATGVLDYFNNVVELDFPEDKYVKAVQFIPGDKRVLHHLLAYITSPKNDEGVVDEANVRDFLEGYAPGKTDVTVFPEDAGVFIPKGHNLTMQMHYTTFGKEVVDQTKVGLWFYDEPPKYKYLTKSVSLGFGNIEVEPNDPEHALNKDYVWEHDVLLYAMRPHMHYRGKAFKFSVIYPDGRRETLMNVPNYNFAWQPTYRLEEPIFIPAGSRVINDGVFDNSEYNPGNPDPSTTARGGLQSWHEMFIGYYTYVILDEGEERFTSASAD